MRHILWCSDCKEYTMQETCRCGKKTENPKPARYSPEDSYGEYRRKAKEQEWKEKGIL